jgi:hypothetical protein
MMQRTQSILLFAKLNKTGHASEEECFAKSSAILSTSSKTTSNVHFMNCFHSIVLDMFNYPAIFLQNIA